MALSGDKLVMLLSLMSFFIFCLVIFLFIFTILEAKKVKARKENDHFSRRSSPALSSVSSLSSTSFYSTSTYCSEGLNSQNKVKKILNTTKRNTVSLWTMEFQDKGPHMAGIPGRRNSMSPGEESLLYSRQKTGANQLSKKGRAKKLTRNLRTCEPGFKLKLETELEEKYVRLPEEYLDQENSRRSSQSVSSELSTSFSSVSKFCLERMNSQEAAKKLLHMLANPYTVRRNSYEEAISMFTGQEATAKQQLSERRG